MVLVFSGAANNSDEIKKELSLASRHRLPVLALRIEDVEPNDAFAYELSTRQWIDAFEGWDKSLDALVCSIDQSETTGPTASALDSHTKRARRIRIPKAGYAIAAIVLLVLIAGWFVIRPSNGAAHSMQVRLTGFTRLSADLPTTLPAALNEEIGTAFNDDGVIEVSTAPSPSGDSPAYALGGTVTHDGDKVKLIVRLMNERTGATLWSNKFDYDAGRMDHVARWASVDVSQAVRCGLFGASTYPKPLADAVLSKYLRFCDHSSAAKDVDLTRAIVADVPDFSWGWSALGYATGGLAYDQPTGPKREIFLKQSLAAVNKAIALDASNSEALTLKSYLIDPNDLVGREALLTKALAARALACGCEHHEYAEFLMEAGRVNDALREFERSLDVLPLNAGTRLSLAQAMLMQGNPSGAAKHLDAAQDLRDAPGLTSNIKSINAAITGKNNGADKAVSDPKLGVPSSRVSALADAFKALDGTPEDRARALGELTALPGDQVHLREVALMASLGGHGPAMKFLAENIQQGTPTARKWLWFPSMDGLRRDPAFPVFLSKVGLIQYWRTTKTKPDLCTDRNPPPFCRAI